MNNTSFKTASVLLTLPLTKPYHYKVPQGMSVRYGDIVQVPFGPRKCFGVVWETSESADSINPDKLKSIVYHSPYGSLQHNHRRFIEWVAQYTMSPVGSVLKLMVPDNKALEPSKQKTMFSVNEELVNSLNLSYAQKKIVHFMREYDRWMSASEIVLGAKTSAQTIKNMVAQELLQKFETEPKKTFHPVGPITPMDYSVEQQKAIQDVSTQIAQDKATISVLDGVTGSGKTEIYFEALSKVIQSGRQVLILLPEISLSPQVFNRFKSRFGSDPVLWHSEITAANKKHIWRGVNNGEVQVVIGARSALMLPYKNLGLIIVDEEHETAYKQEEGVIYHARDMAVARGALDRIPVILASATPSLETLINCKSRKYTHIPLTSRFGKAQLPAIKVIDMTQLPKEDQKNQWISIPLAHAIRSTVNAGEQVLLFLNRRGYAPLTLCRACGERIGCPHCSSYLVEHKHLDYLLCHHCGYRKQLPKACESCGEEETFVSCGPGVERLAEEVTSRFPNYKSVVISSDALSSAKALSDTLQQIEAKEVDIIIGTQMMAKGHHFPGITLVGVIDADLGLLGGDIRGCEKTYQLLHQVSGRAGRGEDPGTVYLQTYHAAHPVLETLKSGNRETFMEQEIASREMTAMPPYGRLATLLLSGAQAGLVEFWARECVRCAPQYDNVQILGPAPAPIALLRGKYRWRIMINAEKKVNIQNVVRTILKPHKIPQSIKIHIDIDPVSFV